MRKLPPLHALRAFEAAARHLHFGHAAAELGVDPTAISHQIRKLEAILGGPLFIRRPRPMRLTAEGEALYPEIRAAFDRMANAVEQGRATARRTLTISTTMAFAAEWLTPRLTQLSQELGVDVHIDAENRPVDLDTGEIDLALRSQFDRGHKGLWRHLFDDRLIAVAAPGLLEEYPNRGNAEGPIDLPLIQYRWTSQNRESLDWSGYFAQSGQANRDLNIVASFSEESHAVGAALSAMGAALLSECLIADRLARGELVRIGETSLAAPALWAVSRDDHPQAAQIAAAIAWIAAARPLA
ncbi:LysR substrate-binding domain-containing protein [Alteriqipengyuania lutimaris]|uniref:LysR family transcriptional regulator n=1 Tax=Alteriqipengyuania lutimaris TaxID=1538146 RepID=A0A395LHX3_9SPHN|nr:LysR substrate-binding domain-containing protein [Alteriqipengyuania lutimaris]MBB3034624.1 LysR family glycine cleavage system transcriptional activator [Alteriqipengyuania lutimaris]RDS76503.1 LysR family transcriptional regulator [Alteriqipengyuania lutimaris]